MTITQISDRRKDIAIKEMPFSYEMLGHGGNTIGTTCVVDRDDTAYMVVDREFRLPTEKYGCRYTTQTQCVVNRTSKTRENRFLIIADRQRGIKLYV